MALLCQTRAVAVPSRFVVENRHWLLTLPCLSRIFRLQIIHHIGEFHMEDRIQDHDASKVGQRLDKCRSASVITDTLRKRFLACTKFLLFVVMIFGSHGLTGFPFDPWHSAMAAENRINTAEHTAKKAQPALYTEWPFNPAEAHRRQQETAAAIGMPVTKELSLSNEVTMKFTLIPAGEFQMGSTRQEADRLLARYPDDKWVQMHVPHEVPRHHVRLVRPVYMTVTEVTQKQFETIVGRNPSQFRDLNRPVDNVSWHDAQEMCEKLGANVSKPVGDDARAKAGDGWPQGWEVSLPTEAEWEYACRAGSAGAYCFGNNAGALSRYCWFEANGNNMTQPAGQKRANAWGLHDMHGNVWEWCADRYGDDYYDQSPITDPTGPARGRFRVIRGGSWKRGGPLCRSAQRCGGLTNDGLNTVGFRIVLRAGPQFAAHADSNLQEDEAAKAAPLDLSRLEKGMTKRQVEMLLGSPDSRMGSGVIAIWTYKAGAKLRFENRKLIEWEKAAQVPDPGNTPETRRDETPEEPGFFLLTVMTKTGDGKRHGTDDGVFMRVNGLERLKVGLNNKGNDRERSAIDRYNKLRIDYPLSQVRFIEIVFNGNDAWFLEKIALKFTSGNKESRIYSRDVNRWFSTQGVDRKNPEMRALIRARFPIRPVLDRPAR
jgi:formylglycine-generating enzyme required for sulfatase activity